MPRNEDEYDDRDDRRRDDYDDDRDADRDRPRRSIVEDAKRKAQIPAILLIITGVIGIAIAILSFISLGSFDQNIANRVAQIEQDPAIPADQKKMQIEMTEKIANGIKPFLPALYSIMTVVGILTVVGGVKLMALKSRGLVMSVSILSMIPFVSGCCCLGLPVGIWAIIALNNEKVTAGYRQVARLGSNRGDDY